MALSSPVRCEQAIRESQSLPDRSILLDTLKHLYMIAIATYVPWDAHLAVVAPILFLDHTISRGEALADWGVLKDYSDALLPGR